MKRRGGFTLVEILTAVAVTGLVYLLVGYAAVQLASASRSGREAAREQLAVLRAAERLRWQLRSLALAGDPPVHSEPGTASGREFLAFFTSRPAGGRGVVEVGYTLREDEEGTYLAYREFPFPRPSGLHPPSDQEEAPWQPLVRGVAGFKVEYSPDGFLWQREWSDAAAPRGIRVTLEYGGREPLVVTVIPGVGARRW